MNKFVDCRSCMFEGFHGSEICGTCRKYEDEHILPSNWKIKDDETHVLGSIHEGEIIKPKDYNSFKELTDHLAKVLQKKNNDYGNSFDKSYEKRGLTMVAIRLEDKLSRLDNLIDNTAEVDESIDDTLLDLAGYAILALKARGYRG